MIRSHSARLPAYLAVAVGGLLVAIASGRPTAAAIAAPAALASVVGVVLARRPTLVTALHVPGPRVLEGDELEVGVEVAAGSPVDLEVLVPMQRLSPIGAPVVGRRATPSTT